jgi:hypothetical protein
MTDVDAIALLERLVRIETKIDVSHQTHADHEDRIRTLEASHDPKAHEDYESRLRRLERALWLVTGAAAVTGGVVGQVGTRLLGG